MNQDRIENYQTAYFSDYGFERIMVHFRRRLLLERLVKLQPAIVVEVGCGSELLISHWIQNGGAPAHWLVVEPGKQFAKIATDAGHPGLHVVNDYFESAVPEIIAKLPRPPDLVICAGLLQEVPSASELLSAMYAVMGPETVLHVNVPNADSLHRRIARSMGLIKDVKELSDQNKKFFQHQVFDMTSLLAEAETAGFRLSEKGGYMVKPFTHAQMLEIANVLDTQVMNGLYEMGREMPDIASEIFVELRK